jgi:hypothetical protein
VTKWRPIVHAGRAIVNLTKIFAFVGSQGRRFLLAFAFTALVAGPVIAQPAAPPSSETLKQDSSRTTPAGTTFTAAARWMLTTRAGMVVLEPPEADSHVVIVDVKAKDAAEAVAAAWAAYRPDFKRPLKIALILSVAAAQRKAALRKSASGSWCPRTRLLSGGWLRDTRAVRSAS